MQDRIPKVIHYCWFGRNPLPDLAVKCIESWRKFCPDYEIIQWNEDNFCFDDCLYAKEAYESKKWAFVSDYARFKILYENGGVYFDTDVELIKPIEDILNNGPFFGMEGLNVAPGLGMAANKENEIYKIILDYYDNHSFINEDGTMNQTTVVKYTTDILLQHGLKESDEIQNVEGIFVYPEEYFCPMNYKTGVLKITENTRSIHHYSASWLNGRQKLKLKIRHLIFKLNAGWILDIIKKNS